MVGVAGLLREFFRNVWVVLADYFWSFIAWAYDGLTVLLNYAATFLPGELSTQLKALFNSDTLTSLRPIYDVTAWAFPVYPMLAVAALMFSCIGIIRMARWAFAFIPTLGG